VLTDGHNGGGKNIVVVVRQHPVLLRFQRNGRDALDNKMVGLGDNDLMLDDVAWIRNKLTADQLKIIR